MLCAPIAEPTVYRAKKNLTPKRVPHISPEVAALRACPQVQKQRRRGFDIEPVGIATEQKSVCVHRGKCDLRLQDNRDQGREDHGQCLRARRCCC